MRLQRSFLTTLFIIAMLHNGNAQTEIAVPSWILQGNIYEVNVRQYTPEGTFKAFEKHLPRLKKMGVQTLWFMPMTAQLVKEDKKGNSTAIMLFGVIMVLSILNMGPWHDWLPVAL